MNRKLKKMLIQMFVTLVGATFFLLVIIPWFTGRMREVVQRPQVRMQQQLAAKQAEAERKAQAERETMSNVRRLVREGKAEDALRREIAADPGVSRVTKQEVEFDKEGAWLRWYKRPAACAEGNSVECGNDYIRKRREFEALVSAGKFR